MFPLLEMIRELTEELQSAGIEQSRRESEELIAHHLGLKRLALYLQFDRPLIPSEVEGCRALARRRSLGEPLQYIYGEIDFFGASIGVSPGVLIPRPETELLVSRVAAELKGMSLIGGELLDLCSGSGCIGIALKKAHPALQVTLSDLSSSALAIAEENARRNNVSLRLVQGDLLNTLDRSFDFIVCNPPYISNAEFPGLQREVRDFEPYSALVGGPTGLEFYERLSLDLGSALKSGGRAWLEVGALQGLAVEALFAGGPWARRELSLDDARILRFFSLERE